MNEIKEKLFIDFNILIKSIKSFKQIFLSKVFNSIENRIEMPLSLSSVAKFTRGKVMSKKYMQENDGIYPVYSSQTKNSGIMGQIKTFMYEGQYVTWTTDGANAGTFFYRNGQFSITNICGIILNSEKNVYNKFLYYFLIFSSEALKEIMKGGTMPHLYPSDLEKVFIKVPNLIHQQEIIGIIFYFLWLFTFYINVNSL